MKKLGMCLVLSSLGMLTFAGCAKEPPKPASGGAAPAAAAPAEPAAAAPAEPAAAAPAAPAAPAPPAGEAPK